MRASAATTHYWGHYNPHPVRLEAAIIILNIVNLALAIVSIATDYRPFIDYSGDWQYGGDQAVFAFLIPPIVNLIFSLVHVGMWFKGRGKMSLHPTYTLVLSMAGGAVWAALFIVYLEWYYWGYTYLNHNTPISTTQLIFAVGVFVCYFVYYSISIAALAVLRRTRPQTQPGHVADDERTNVQMDTVPQSARPMSPISSVQRRSIGAETVDTEAAWNIVGSQPPRYQAEMPEGEKDATKTHEGPFEVVGRTGDEGLQGMRRGN